MTLPSRDVIEDLNELIKEITGFKEDQENFVACQQYCLSHVVHHSYSSVSKNAVTNVMQGLESRFYGHGYFKVAEALNSQLKCFLSNNELFKKNPEFDIQWILLSLLSNLSSNLTSVSKVPELLPTDDDQEPEDDINWAEYLNQDFLRCSIEESENEENDDDDSSFSDESDEIFETQKKKSDDVPLSTHQIDDSESVGAMVANEYLPKKNIIDQFIENRAKTISSENDRVKRGNFTQHFEALLSSKGVIVESCILSELEMIENILYQFQTGEDPFRKKGIYRPALCSLTHETVASFLDHLQPYFKIVKTFKDFSDQVKNFRYCEAALKKCSGTELGQAQKVVREASCEKESKDDTSTLKCQRNYSHLSYTTEKTIPNVIKAYNAALMRAFEPFEEKIMELEVDRSSLTLLRLERELRPYFKDLSSLYRVHSVATAKWLEEPNWKCAVRILSVLYNAIVDATSRKMSFLFMDIFLNCFRVYLDIIDSWIACVSLTDPHEEFIITRLKIAQGSEDMCCEFASRPYKQVLTELKFWEMPILDLIAEKMTHAGQSLEVLSHLDKVLNSHQSIWNDVTQRSTLYQSLVKSIETDVRLLLSRAQINPNLKQAKDKSIFTVKNVNNPLISDDGGGEYEEKVKDIEKQHLDDLDEKRKNRESDWSFSDNVFFEMAFREVFDCFEPIQKDKFQLKSASDGTESLFCQLNSEFRCTSLTDPIFPLHIIVNSKLSLILEERCSLACKLVKDSILQDKKLKTHLALLQSVLLYNDAYLLQPFTSVFFSQPDVWQNSYSLTLHLKECVEVMYRDFAAGVSVSVAENSLPCNILEAINDITINYEINWPLTIIITADSLAKLNQIFRLILKLKWAHSTLCNLRFQETDADAPHVLKSTYHRLQMLRFWCLSDLCRVSNYFTAQLSSSFGEHLEACQNLKDIIRVVDDFVAVIYSKCLLGVKSKEGRDLIFSSLIPLCKDLEGFWSKNNIIADTKLKLMEDIFQGLHKQLCHLMAALEKEERSICSSKNH